MAGETAAQETRIALLHALLAYYELRSERRLAAVLKALQRVPLKELEAALLRRDAFAIHDLAARLPFDLRPVARDVATAFQLGVRYGGAALGDLGIQIRFDAKDPWMIRAAAREAARMVTAVTNDTRAAIRAIVARAFGEGLTPAVTARMIRSLIGLTARQAMAVIRERARLIAAGVSQPTTQARMDRYAAKLLRHRSLTIARTEIIGASAKGQLESWHEARRRGLLPAGSLKVWMITRRDERVCQICRPLSGVAVPLDEPFIVPRGKYRGLRVMAPAAHPNCRCALAVRSGTVARKRAA